VTTAGEASELDLNPVVVHSQKFGYDLIQVEVTMTDKDNSVIPDASSLVEFSLEGEGEIIGVCNSDYQSLESYQSNFRQLYQGRCLVIIKTRNKNEVELEVKSVELNKSYTLKFNNSSA
jgi:beta-galactosidase